MLCQSVIWAGFGLSGWSMSGILAERYALTVSDWAERTPTERNIERSVTPIRFAHMLWSTPLVYFEWSDVKRCRMELWVRRVASLALLAAEVENFSTFQAPTQASANQIALCKYPSQSHSCNTRKVCDWLLSLWWRVSTKLQTRHLSSVDADALCEWGVSPSFNWSVQTADSFRNKASDYCLYEWVTESLTHSIRSKRGFLQ